MLEIIGYLSLVLLGKISGTSGQIPPANCMQSQNGTLCYELSTDSHTWKNASLFCENLIYGGHLAVIEDQETQIFLESGPFLTEIGAGSGDSYWIGGHLEQLDTWRWENGSVLADEDNGTWPRWAPTHPMEGLFYVYMSSADMFYWRSDQGIFSNVHYICQYEPQCEIGDYEMGGTCFRIHSKIKTYFEARQSCLDEGGYLATVNSPAIFDFLQTALLAMNETGQVNGYWIGLYLAEWSWEDGNLFGFSNWGPAEPADGNVLSIDLICGAQCFFLWFARESMETRRALCEWKLFQTTVVTGSTMENTGLYITSTGMTEKGYNATTESATEPETGTITSTTGDPDKTPGTGTITTTTGDPDKTPGTGTITTTTGDPDKTPGTGTPPGTEEPGPPTGTTTEDVGGTAAPVTALGAWAIVGIAAAVVLLLIIVIVLLCVALKRTSGPDARGVYYTDFDDVHAEGSFREGESKPEGGAVEYTNPVFEQNNIVQTNGHVPVGDTTSATDVDALYAKPIKRGASKPSFYTVDGKLRGDGVYGEVVGDVDIERTSVTSASPPVSENRQQDSVSMIPSESSFAGYTPGQNRESGFPTIDEDSIIDSSQFVTTIILR